MKACVVSVCLSWLLSSFDGARRCGVTLGLLMPGKQCGKKHAGTGSQWDNP
jgi:hypothetical protein